MTYIPWSCIWKFCFTVSASAMPLTIDWSGVWIHVGAHVVSVDPSYMSSCVFEYEKKRALDGDFDSVEYPFQQMVKDPGKYCRIHFIFTLCYVPLKSQMGTQVTMLCPIDNAFTDL